MIKVQNGDPTYDEVITIFCSWLKFHLLSFKCMIWSRHSGFNLYGHHLLSFQGRGRKKSKSSLHLTGTIWFVFMKIKYTHIRWILFICVNAILHLSLSISCMTALKSVQFSHLWYGIIGKKIFNKAFSRSLISAPFVFKMV